MPSDSIATGLQIFAQFMSLIFHETITKHSSLCGSFKRLVTVKLCRAVATYINSSQPLLVKNSVLDVVTVTVLISHGVMGEYRVEIATDRVEIEIVLWGDPRK